ncbi:MAG TPA: hypothetical protein PKK48_07530 [Phycisphaerae bacterium]|nr:hypothetical protein [Phycisphaerae bacterium]HPS52840.1 hypothetical protein [Phycisphaerae bacterium]
MKKVILGLMLLGVVSGSSFAQIMGMDVDDSKMKVKILKTGADPKYQLKQDFPAGKYRMTVDMNIKQSMVSDKQQPMPMNVSMKFIVLADISDYDKDGVKSLKFSYESVEMVTPMGSGKAVRGQKPAADKTATSQPAGGNMMQMQAEQLVEIEGITVKMDKTGKIISIEGVENMPGGQADMIANLVKDVSTSQKYPAVGVGGAFDVSAEAEMPMMGSMLIDTVTTLVSVDKTDKGNIGKLQSEITMSLKKDAAAAQKDDAAKKDEKAAPSTKPADADAEDEDENGGDVNAPKLDMQMNMKGAFTTTMDLATGLAIESVGTMTNDMTVQAGPQGAMKMHQVIEMKMTTEPVK